MANTSYPKGMEKLLSGSINVPSDTIKAALLPNTYALSAAHEYLSQLGSLVGIAQTLTGKSVTGGVFDADDVDFGALAPGSNVGAMAIFKDTGNASTSPVLLFCDTATGLPMVTNGGAVTIPWDDGPKKIARLNLPFFPKGGEKVWAGTVNFLTDTLKVALLPGGYAYDPEHEFLDDVGSTIGTAQTLTGKSITGGVFDADDANFGALAEGSAIGSAAIFKDTGSAATSPLLLHVTDVIGLPLATNGSGVQMVWSNGAAKIINLVPV